MKSKHGEKEMFLFKDGGGEAKAIEEVIAATGTVSMARRSSLLLDRGGEAKMTEEVMKVIVKNRKHYMAMMTQLRERGIEETDYKRR